VSPPAPTEPPAPPVPPAPPAPSALVRRAGGEDLAEVAAAVSELLVELGASPPPTTAIEAAARELVEDGRTGVLLVAEDDGGIVGVLGASTQSAMHVPGRYLLIQDLWVHRSWRSRAIGAALIGSLCTIAREAQIARIEVGLPRESFAQIRATEAFYMSNGFEPLGPRMRLVLR
jgi:GNAT superfamily N-acetyltransferase